MKRSILIVLCLLLVLSVTAAAYAAGSASMSLNVSNGTVYRGDTVTVTVKLNNNQPVSNGGITLKFDSNVFEITGGSHKVSALTAVTRPL